MRTTPGRGRFDWFWVLLFLLAGVSFLTIGTRAFYLSSCLSSTEGEHTQGVIDKMWETVGKWHHQYIAYHYAVGTSIKYSQQEVHTTVQGRYFVGSSVPITYLKDSPGISRIDLPGEKGLQAYYSFWDVAMGAFATIASILGLWRMFNGRWKSKVSERTDNLPPANPVAPSWQKADVPEPRHGD